MSNHSKCACVGRDNGRRTVKQSTVKSPQTLWKERTSFHFASATRHMCPMGRGQEANLSSYLGHPAKVMSDASNKREPPRMKGLLALGLFLSPFCFLFDSEMVRGYERGITPNPDVLCNRHIKFGTFFKYAVEKLGTFAGSLFLKRKGGFPAILLL